MRITNLKSGENYHLAVGAQMEVERTNPFFNDYGEQSVPLSLPASPHNVRLLGFPDHPGLRLKSQPIDAAIADGEYYVTCRQYVLSAQQNGDIETNFYMNDGSFYSKIQNVRLKDIFKGEFVSGVSTIDEGISFCRSLRYNTNSTYGICMLLLTDDSGVDSGYDYKFLNNWCHVDKANGSFIFGDMYADADFYNAKDRTEYVNGSLIKVPAGYYITPFFRASYVLKRVMSYFGYQLADCLFTYEQCFADMLLLHTVIDTLVNGSIKHSDLVPDVTVADFINLFRLKFCCEFVPDELQRKMNVVFFNDVFESQPTNLSACVVGKPIFGYMIEKDYKRVVLKSDEKLNSEVEEIYDDFTSLKKANPTITFTEGAIYKVGYTWTKDNGVKTLMTKIGSESMDYNTGESDIEEEEKTIPELIPEMRQPIYTDEEGAKHYAAYNWLYAGDGVTLNSRIEANDSEKNYVTEDAPKQHLMLSFVCDRGSDLSVGTISDSLWDIRDNGVYYTKMFDYSLHYYGETGIFEKFWRKYDSLMRNALNDVKAALKLTQSQKMNIAAHEPVVINGVKCFFNKLKFTLGGNNEPIESELKTASIQSPETSSPYPDEMFSQGKGYRWVAKTIEVEITEEQYDALEVKNTSISVIYPPIAESKYVGIENFKQTAYIRKGEYKKPYRIDFWLECVAD